MNLLLLILISNLILFIVLLLIILAWVHILLLITFNYLYTGQRFTGVYCYTIVHIYNSRVLLLQLFSVHIFVLGFIVLLTIAGILGWLWIFLIVLPHFDLNGYWD